jgi:hypothetical protein
MSRINNSSMSPGASPGGGGKSGGKGGGYTGSVGSCGYGQMLADQRPRFDNQIKKRKKKKKHDQ